MRVHRYSCCQVTKLQWKQPSSLPPKCRATTTNYCVWKTEIGTDSWMHVVYLLAHIRFQLIIGLMIQCSGHDLQAEFHSSMFGSRDFLRSKFCEHIVNIKLHFSYTYSKWGLCNAVICCIIRMFFKGEKINSLLALKANRGGFRIFSDRCKWENGRVP